MSVDMSLELPFVHLDDESFMLSLFELRNGHMNFNVDRLESLHFNPFLLEGSLVNNADLDPDQQFFNQRNSKYNIPEQFNDNAAIFDCSSFSLMHHNIRSLNKNLSNLTDLLSILNLDFDVIGLTETWLQCNQNIHPIENYSFVHNSRPDKTGGGVGLFIKESINFKSRQDLDLNNYNIMESIFIELLKTNESNVIIGTIYRPPNADIDLFISKMNELLTKISKEQKTCYLLGDFNLDLLRYHEHNGTNDFLDTLFSYCFMPLINNPTRITSHSATLIDNIFVNDPSIMQQLLSGILFSDISDHLPIFTIHHNKSHMTVTNVKVIRRDINPRTLSKFHSELNNCRWDDVYQSSDPNVAYDRFLDKYNNIYNTNFPLKEISKKKAKLISKPWITKGLFISIKHKSVLYKKFLRCPSEINNHLYKQYKNKLNNLLKIAKKIITTSNLKELQETLEKLGNFLTI